MPKSCEDLWKIGQNLNGLYSVMGAKMVESVYCDFTKLSYEAGFQTWIGAVDVKSSPVYFYVQRKEKYAELNTPIPFNVDPILNAGGAMNSASGKFTAPVAGRYFFSFTGLVHFSGSSSRLYFVTALFKNGVSVGEGESDEISTTPQHETFSIQSTLDLKRGDQIWVEIIEITPGVALEGFTHFNGFLLEEEISQSLTNYGMNSTNELR